MSIKKLPYGNCNFADLIESGYAYVDKTRNIELLENENNRYQYMLRPRRFGKSLFLSVMENYYCLNKKDKFESLFGDLYLGKHPTPERGTYTVLRFDFSTVKTETPDDFRTSFSHEVQEGVCKYINSYQSLFTGAEDDIRSINEKGLGVDALRVAYRLAAGAGVPIFVMIDEYDNFANNLIAMGSAYSDEVMDDGIVRTFYKSLKAATASVAKRIFMTGVSPMMLNDLTSGFNMATNLSLQPKYNEMFGFTREEVEWLIDQTGVDRKYITVDMESYYNGYMFDNDGEHKVYNSQMVLFLFDQIMQRNNSPKEIIDPNLKTGYERLHSLAANENNRAKMLNIMRDGGIYGDIIGSFSIGELNSENHFISMLFYLGMLTCGGTFEGETFLKIPNYSIQTLYWEYLVEYIRKGVGEGSMDTSKLSAGIRDMAYRGNIKPYLEFFVENFPKRLSNRDLAKFDEKYIKVMMLSSLYFNRLYHPVSEHENNNGYSDIYLVKNAAIPDIKYEHVLEIKYIKTGADKSDAEIENEKEEKFAEALAQIEKYKKDTRFANRDDLKFAAIVFRGKGDYELREDV